MSSHVHATLLESAVFASSVCFICKMKACHYDKQQLQAFSATREEKICCCHRARRRASRDSQLTLWLWEVLQDLTRSRYGLSWMWAIGGRRRYHPSATSPGPNGLPHVCLCVCCVHTTYPLTLFFMSEYQQAAQCQASQMDSLIHLFAWSSFNPQFWSPSQKCT